MSKTNKIGRSKLGRVSDLGSGMIDKQAQERRTTQASGGIEQLGELRRIAKGAIVRGQVS